MRFHCIRIKTIVLAALFASLVVITGGCDTGIFKPAKLDSKTSPDGRFRAELERADSSLIVGHFIYTVVLHRVRPSWKDFLTLNRSDDLCQLDEPGYLSLEWTDSSHLTVACWDCKRGALGLADNQWQGVSVEYKYAETPPNQPDADKRGVRRLSK
jgi:hypothetical protein